MDYKIKSKFWIETKNKHFIGLGRIKLLEKIDEYGSISKAAKALKMSYKAAWDAINDMNNLSDIPLVESMAGGEKGGGSRLTEKGKELINFYKNLEQNLALIVENPDLIKDNINLIRRFSLQTSARNQFSGKVLDIKKGAINSEIIIGIKGEDRISAVITKDSLKRLNIKKGDELIALIKASSVILMHMVDNIKIGACNKLAGEITKINTGAVNNEVIVALKGGNILTAVITKDSCEDMELKTGSKVFAIFKASDVIVGEVL